MSIDKLLEAKDQLCAVVPRKVTMETLEACELALHNLAVSSGSIRVKSTSLHKCDGYSYRIGTPSLSTPKKGMPLSSPGSISGVPRGDVL